MNFIKTAIDGVFIIEPKVFNDPRGSVESEQLRACSQAVSSF